MIRFKVSYLEEDYEDYPQMMVEQGIIDKPNYSSAIEKIEQWYGGIDNIETIELEALDDVILSDEIIDMFKED